MYYKILMEELNKFNKEANDEQKATMIETLADKLYEMDKNDLAIASLISIFTDALDWW
jgi:hypothetical protein|tara:strand:- start:1572 stop:1745 length:174 start_codon:yes stop_codon:yes gene_type:complete